MPDGRNPQTTVDEVLVDARALQDRRALPSWAIDRVVDLLAAIRHCDWPRGRPNLVGLVDHAAEPLNEPHRLFFDEVATSRIRPGRRSRWFISLAPMSHDPVWALPILLDPQVFKVASIPGPVSIDQVDRSPISFARRADHLICLAWLSRYDVFAVPTQRVKADLERARSIEPSRIVVGADLRGGSRASPGSAVPFSRRRHVAVMLRGAERDEVAAVLAAHARAQDRLSLVLIGDCPPAVRGELRSAYVREGGSLEALDFAEPADDGPLGSLLSEALLTVFPSSDGRAFASCAIGSMALGTPVVVCGGDEMDRASISAPNCSQADHRALTRIFDAMAGDVTLWERASLAALDEGGCEASQAEARRLLDALVVRASARPPAPAVGRGLRPCLAMVAALPPAPSEGAARTIVAMEALARRLEVHAFSDTSGAVPGGVVRSLAPVRSFELHPQRFDASLAVLGNSRRHAGSFRHVMENGGAALVHDAHLAGFYAAAFGLDRTLALGRAEHGRSFTAEQVLGWAREQHGMPTLFLSEVARAAAPLLVTSDAAHDAVAHRYGVEPRLLPPLQHRGSEPDLPSAERDALREAFGWRRDTVALVSFGLDASAAAVVLWALRLLRDWRVDARLVLCGADRTEAGRLIRELDLGDAVAIPGEGAPGQGRSGWLAAADLAVQLGTYPLAGPSAALMACLAAALPTVSNDRVARAAEAPAFVSRIPDALSPVLVAEAALGIVSSGKHRQRPVDEARAFEADHSPDRYALALAAALGLDAGPA